MGLRPLRMLARKWRSRCNDVNNSLYFHSRDFAICASSGVFLYRNLLLSSRVLWLFAGAYCMGILRPLLKSSIPRARLRVPVIMKCHEGFMTIPGVISTPRVIIPIICGKIRETSSPYLELIVTHTIPRPCYVGYRAST